MNVAGYVRRAMARSYRNRGTVLAPDVPELVDALNLIFQERYGQASGLNPAVFLKTAVLAWTGANWVIPADCDTMVKMTKASGEEVFVVAIDNLTAEPTEAAVYRQGRAYFPAGNPNDPVNQPLIAYYDQIPAALVDDTSVPDAAWPQQFDTMIVLDLALWLAMKDGRTDDLQALTPEHGRWDGQYQEWLERESLGLIRQFAKAATSPAVVSAKVVGT